MSDGDDKPRWQYRVDNFSRALVLLREGVETLESREVTQLEREGLVQRFEYTWELAWKALSDYLSYLGVQVSPISPRTVIRAAHEADIITDGADWMDALDARNRMSHTYNFQAFEEVVAQIRSRFLRLFENLYDYLLARMVEEQAFGS